MSTRSTPLPSTARSRHHDHVLDAVPPQRPADGLKGVLLPVAIVLLIGSIFVSVYLAAFHAPEPHDLPVAVVGTAQQARQTADGLERGLPGGFEVKRYTDESAARHAVQDRTAYAAYVTGADGPPELLYAGANGPSVTSTVSSAFSALAQSSGRTLVVKDVVPAADGDTRSMSVFYAAFGLVLAGFLFGMMTYQMAPRLEFRRRMLSLASFSVLGGVIVALLTGSLGFGALPGPFLGIAGLVALMGAAVGSATMAIMRLFGRAGLPLASVILLTLGNSTSGGTLPAAYLPGWLRPLSEILPVGVGVRAVQGLSHFDNDGLVQGITILAGWTVLCAGLVFWRDAPARRPTATTQQA
ncbi:ABC transporter permease [Streptomyces sp. ME02-8801-2C]|uniref:ABC transporter permease n=1 Tax=Streptomyces sp. ME02-8801-2C TaxID=3028680 RepID=UPI0029A37D3D|nr:ABC transporter permease [Streptomyces sp. ME02-8801-2C]MDX3452857.1 ABC transporter permease [Streptomyces sp. ME02-8801-2C]